MQAGGSEKKGKKDGPVWTDDTALNMIDVYRKHDFMNECYSLQFFNEIL